jgi:signal transduction histidine kinase
MVSNLSHELKTPLASIRGAAELLEGGASNDPPARARFLSNIRTEVQRLDRIVTNFLKLSRIEASPLSPAATTIDLTSLIREIAERYAERASELSVRLRTEIVQDAVLVRIDEMAVKQILTNLLDNALQFTANGDEILLSLLREDGSALIRIQDNGVGIEPELLPKVFDRFFTTENPRTNERGTGLGLAIVRSLVESHRGAVSVTSTPGAGTEFVVRFPLESSG